MRLINILINTDNILIDSLKMTEMQEKNQSNTFESVEMDSTNITEIQGLSLARPKYGNMHILFENQKFLFTLGPDYFCFFIALICFILLEILVTSVLFQKDYTIMGFIFMFGGIIQSLSYIIVAISNPGIATEVDFDTEGEQEASKTKKICKVCNLPMLPRMRHCRACGVCIKGYDHHCPWTSKCIGENNLYRFYFFAIYTPFYIIGSIIVLSICA